MHLPKETLRYHNIIYHLARAAGKDDIIPLAYPIVTKTGDTISEIPVAAGQVIMPNVTVYNRYENTCSPVIKLAEVDM